MLQGFTEGKNVVFDAFAGSLDPKDPLIKKLLHDTQAAMLPPAEVQIALAQLKQAQMALEAANARDANYDNDPTGKMLSDLMSNVPQMCCPGDVHHFFQHGHMGIKKVLGLIL
jgi:hypothetical protein